jgi:hypothetical protein
VFSGKKQSFESVISALIIDNTFNLFMIDVGQSNQIGSLVNEILGSWGPTFEWKFSVESIIL